MHLSEGEIRAYQDHELTDAEHQRVQAHLASCLRCQAAAQEVEGRARRIAAQFSRSYHDPAPILPARIARLRLAERATNAKENQSMWNKLFHRMPRAAWAALTVIAVLSIALAFPSVRALAGSFLGLFRVEQIRLVSVDAENLSGRMGSSEQLEQLFTNNVTVEENGEMQEVADVQAANALVDYTVRSPEFNQTPSIVVQPGGSLTFNVDLQLVRSILQDLDRPDIELPDNLNGAQVKLEMTNGVMMTDCAKEEMRPENFDPDEPDQPSQVDCTTFMQIPSPTITAPPELNLSQIGEAYLQVLGMDAEEAASFARNVDWTTTFILPVPRGYNYKDVSVDGVTGTLILQYSHYTLLWVKNGIVYSLSGNGDTADALAVAASIK